MKKIFSILSAGLSAIALSLLASGCVEEMPEVVENLELTNLLTPTSTSAVVDASAGTTVTFSWANSNNAANYRLEIYEFRTGDENTPASAADVTEEMLTEENLTRALDVAPAEEGSQTSIVVKDLNPEMSLYARVCAQSSADPDTRTTGDSKWAVFPYPIDTYSVMDKLPSYSVTDRTSTTISVQWTLAEGDTDGINQIRISPDPTDPNPENPTSAFLSVPVAEGAASATIENLKPSVKYTVALHFNSANRGQMFVWTTPDFTQAQYAKDTAELRHYLREAASIKDGVPMKIVLTNLDEVYDLDGSADILGPVEILGQQSPDGSRSPVIKGRLDIMPPLTQNYSYATADPSGSNPAGIAGTIEASAENPTAGATSVRIEAIEFDGDGYNYDRPVSLSSLSYPKPEGAEADSGPFFTEPLSVYIVNCDIHGYSAGFLYDNSKAAEYTTIVIDNNIVTDTEGSGGDGFDLRAATTIANVTMTNNTFSNGMRTFIRIDKGTLSALEFSNNTVNNLASVDDGNNKGLFNIRATLSGDFSITDNLFLNLNGCPARTVMFPAQATAFPTAVSGNYFYNLAETFFYADSENKVAADEFPESKAIAGGGAVLSSDPCENSSRGIFNVTDAAVSNAGAGDPRWLVEYVPAPMDPLIPVQPGDEWVLNSTSTYGKSIEETTVIENTKFIVTSNPINVLDEGMEFSAEATLEYSGVPVDCAIAFMADSQGSIFASALRSDSGTVNDHITVAVGPADGSSATVVGAIPVGAYNQKVVFDDIEGETLIYLYACGPVVLSGLEWSDDVNTGSSALADPEVTADESTAGALTLSWQPVENAGSYIISFGTKEPDAEYAEDEYIIDNVTATSYTWENFPSGTYTVNVQAVPAEPEKFTNSLIIGKTVTVAAPAQTPMSSGSITREDMEFLLAVVGNGSFTSSIYYKNFLFTASDSKKPKFNSADATGAFFNTGGSSHVDDTPGRTIRFIAAGPGKLTYITVSNDSSEERRHSIAINGKFGEDKISKARPSSVPADWSDYTYIEELTTITSGTIIDLAGGNTSDLQNINYLSVSWEPAGGLPPVAGLTPVTETTTWGADEWAALYDIAENTSDEVTVKTYGKDIGIPAAQGDYFVTNNLMIYGSNGANFRVPENLDYIQLASASYSSDEQPSEYYRCFLRFRVAGNGTLKLTARATNSGGQPGRYVYVAVGGAADAVSVGTVQEDTFEAGAATTLTEHTWNITASNGDAITIFENNALRIGTITWIPAE